MSTAHETHESSEHEPRSARAADLRREAEHLTEEARELWHKARIKMRKPLVGASVAGAVALAAGAMWGPGEAAVAALAAYAVFRILRKRARKHGEQHREEQQQPAT